MKKRSNPHRRLTIISTLLVIVFVINIFVVNFNLYAAKIKLNSSVPLKIEVSATDGYLFEVSKAKPGSKHTSKIIITNENNFPVDTSISIRDEVFPELGNYITLAISGTNGLTHTGTLLDDSKQDRISLGRIDSQSSVTYTLKFSIAGRELGNEYQSARTRFITVIYAEQVDIPIPPTASPTPTPSSSPTPTPSGGQTVPVDNNKKKPDITIPDEEVPLDVPTPRPTPTPSPTPTPVESPSISEAPVVPTESTEEPIIEDITENETPKGPIKKIPQTGEVRANTILSLAGIAITIFVYIYLTKKNKVIAKK